MVEFALVGPLLFLVLIGIFEAGRYVLTLEAVNHATREGARYAIVHGENASCPSGKMPAMQNNPCDPTGANIQAAVADAASGLVSSSALTVPTPIWTEKLSAELPSDPGDTSSPLFDADNSRGNYITVWSDYAYKPIIKTVFDTGLIPDITISAESTLVINY